MMICPLPKTPLRFLWFFLRQQKWSVWGIVACVFLLSLREGAGPYLIKLIIDALNQSVNAGVDYATFPYVPMAALIPLVIYFVIQCFNEWLQTVIDLINRHMLPKVKRQIRETLFNYVQGHAPEYFKNNFAGTLGGRISNTAKTIDFLEHIFLWQFGSPIARLITIMVILALHNWLYVAVLSVWIIIFFTILIKLSPKLRAVSQDFANQEMLFQGRLIDSLSNILSVKAFARKTAEQKFLSDVIMKEGAKDRHMRKWLIFQTFIMRNSTTLIIGVMLYLVLIGWAQGQMTAGEFAMVMMMALQIGYSVNDLGAGLLQSSVHMGYIRDTLNLVIEPHLITDKPDAKALVLKQPSVTFDQVNFHYQKFETVFTELTLSIPTGQKVGLVGHSGAGKTSLANLLLRFYDIQGGQITIDGQNIADVTQESLRQHIAVIPQDTSLFHRSLMDNIRYGRLEATDAEVIAAAKQAYADEFISALPEGYDTLVGERGVKLSGGQRQRIAIARAILKDAPILILDEATSALDSESEQLIQQSLKTLMQGKTVIAIAHRLSTIAHLDRLIVMEDGQIIEDGTHDALLKNKDGAYAKLWSRQSGGFLKSGNPG